VSTSPAGIRLILDQGVPRRSVEILELARARQAAVVTLDADFHAILAVSAAAAPSVVRLRIQGLDVSKVASLVAQVVGRFASDLTQGCLITVKLRKTTCHRLPIAIG
jgi:predicted nuclease of predicted toxin-antitoxin system